MKKSTEASFRRYLNSFMEGARQAFVLCPQQDYIIPNRTDFQNDAAALRGDVTVVARDLKKELSKDVKNNSH